MMKDKKYLKDHKELKKQKNLMNLMNLIKGKMNFKSGNVSILN